MNSNQKFSQTFSSTSSGSFYKDPKSPKPNIAKELSQVERRVFEYSKTLNQKISDFSAKSPKKTPNFEDSDSWELHKAILKRGEDYAKFVLAQNRGYDPHGEVEKVNQNIKNALNSLEDIRNDEQKGLQRKITELNGDFNKKVEDLERNLLRQIEKLKYELMDNIKKEEIESSKRIKAKAEEIIERVAPANQRETIERALRPNNYSSTPQKYRGSPEKKYQSQILQEKVESTREKVKEIMEQPITPIRPRKREYSEGCNTRENSYRSFSSYSKSPATPKPVSSLTEYKNSILNSVSPSKEIFKSSPEKSPISR
ncbi:unnamed protein product [Blepharisma stoltei]|uniref:Uncharacterized protein n=1 Tax=Blepharisma stoltei TaxID=1481888 RepID=A0AAU9IL74_9CILI|nr:unnamed protein product [Blepharisma stoltei]